MANTLKIKRGAAATIPQGELAEPLFTTDTYDLYIGKGSTNGNQRFQKYIASGTSSQFLKGDGSLDSTTYQATSEKGQNNGYASLDAGGKIPAAQLPSSVIEYKGTWNASTNTPTLADGTGDAGDVYIVSVGGTQNLGSGSITFDAGDWVMYNGSVWQKSTGSNAVASVNGQTGIVVLDTDDISEDGSPVNLWFTNARARTAISLTTTGSSGAATYDNSTGVFNVPQYTASGLGAVPTSRQLTINGTAYDLSADRTWSVGTVTSVAALTIGTTGTDIGSSVANGTTTPVITLNIPTASATNRGALSSADWTTFNNKQNALTNPVTGTGTNNQIAYFNATGSTIASLSTATYPSLTELSYVKGVTSAIQTQIDGKQASSTNLTSLAGLTYASTSFVKMTAAGTFALDTNTYLTGNQTITLSGDISGSGTTAITTTIGALKVTNAMLAGSINYSKMDSATVPTWNQNTTGSAATLTTARNFTINGTAKSFDGSANVSWTASEIGLTSYLPLTGGTLTGALSGTSATFSGVTTFNKTSNGTIGAVGNMTQEVGTTADGATKFSGFGFGFNGGGYYPAYIAYYVTSGSGNTYGRLDFAVRNTGSDVAATPALSIASTGAATFSSSVTAGGRINSGNGGGGTASLNAQQLSGDDAAIYALGVATAGSSKGIRILAGTNSSDYALNVASYANSPILYARGDGNVGIGTSSPSQALSIGDGTSTKYVRVQGSVADSYFGSDSVGTFLGNNSNAPLYFQVNSVERMRIGSGGHVSIVSNLAVNSPNSGNTGEGLIVGQSFKLSAGGTGQRAQSFTVSNVLSDTYGSGLQIQYANSADDKGFGFNLNTSGGFETYVKSSGGSFVRNLHTNQAGLSRFSNNGTYTTATNQHEFNNNNNSNFVTGFYHRNTTPFGLQVEYTAADPNGTGSQFLNCQSTGGLRAEIRSNGGLANYSANDVNLSDIRTKKDIAPLDSYWNKFKELDFVKFKYKDQSHNDYNIGLIAQQVEKIAPEFIDTDGWGKTPNDGVPLKTIYTTDLYHAAMAVLKEAILRIEKLENK